MEAADHVYSRHHIGSKCYVSQDIHQYIDSH